MKIKYILLSLLAGSLAMTACKEKTETASPAASQGESGQTVEPEVPVEEPVAPPVSITPEQRAAKLGFAGRLPKEITSYDAILNGRKTFDRVLKSPLGAYLVERMEDEGISMDDLALGAGNDELVSQIALYSEEFFAAYGPGGAESMDLAVHFFERLVYYASRWSVFKLDGSLHDGSKFRPEGEQIFSGPLKGVGKDVLKMLSAFDMPAYYQGGKVTDPETRDLVMAQLEQSVSVLQFLDPAVEEVSFKRGDYEFSGYKIVGRKVAEQIDEDVTGELQKLFGAADVQAFKKTLQNKNLVVVTGLVGDYALVFVGKSEDDLVIVDDVNESICADDRLAFMDQYLDHDLLVVGLSDEATVKAIGGIAPILYRLVGSAAQGLGDGLGAATSLGDTQDLEVIFELLSKQAKQLASMFGGTERAYVAYLDEGLKFESFGGSNMPSMDFDAEHTLAPMGTAEGNLLFANWASNPDYNEKVLEYVDTLGEAGYLAAKRLSSIKPAADGRNPLSFDQWKPGIDLFDQMFRDDVLGIWNALRSDMTKGLGNETALVIDMNGAVPKLPNVPGEVLQKARMPRIAYVSTVDDRGKLQQSWQRLSKSIESLLKKIGQMSGADIPMQMPMSSEKNDLKTWFIPIPFQNDDFVPSVSVSDNLFFASTSKNFSEQLTELAGKANDDARKGAWVHLDFKVLHQYGEESIKLYFDNIDQFTPDENVREDIEANRPMIEGLMKAHGVLDTLTIHIRKEEGQVRNSIHLKTR